MLKARQMVSLPRSPKISRRHQLTWSRVSQVVQDRTGVETKVYYIVTWIFRWGDCIVHQIPSLAGYAHSMLLVEVALSGTEVAPNDKFRTLLNRLRSCPWLKV